MALETVLLAARPGDEGNGAKLAAAAIDIAKPADATVVVGQIFTEDEYDTARTSLGLADDTELSPEKIAEQHGSFNAIVSRLDSQGLDYVLRTAVGPHAGTVVEQAADTDFIIIGGSKRSPAGKAIFGSATQDILLDAPCPVVFVRRE